MLQRAFRVRAPATRTEVFPAPTRGWVQSGNIVTASGDQAEVLDNFIPTAQGARLRGGAAEYADVGASVIRMFTYASGTSETFFAATANDVFDLSTVVTAEFIQDEDGNNILDENAEGIQSAGFTAIARLEGLGSGDWSTVQIGTTGGQFLVGVNGTDYGFYWDGSDFEPITTVAINEIPFDAETSSFTVGQTVTGGTSGASATIYAISKDDATSGRLKVGTITSGPFQDNEALTDGATGAATAAGASASSSAITITGVATTALSQVWLFKRRLFFVEKDTTSAWYLPVDSIGGAATEIDLGAVFSEGGNLLFGATWSLDSGSGLDDVCLFVSDRGEVAVYEGTDPSSASTWALTGVYRIGRPLNKHAFFKAGGDLAILTEDGIVSVSEALRKDRAALQASALSFPIEDAWKDAIANRTSSYPITATLWQKGTLLLVGTPSSAEGTNISFVANARTGAWARVTGWDVRCATVYGDELYFGSESGKVFKADSGGNDDGEAIVARYVPKFTTSDGKRTALTSFLTYRAADEIDFDMYAHADYQVDDMPSPTPISGSSGTAWGTGVWGTFIWGAGDASDTFTNWQQVRATGYALAPGLVIAVNQATAVDFEILSMRLRAETGYAL